MLASGRHLRTVSDLPTGQAPPTLQVALRMSQAEGWQSLSMLTHHTSPSSPRKVPPP